MVDFFGIDAVRYFLLHEMPFENDGVVSWELMIERVNSDLANTLGNLVNRTISMTNKYFGGEVTDAHVTDAVDEDLKAFINNSRLKVNACMEKLRVADALTEIFNIFKRLNKYIDETMPWVLAKDEKDAPRLSTVLYNLTEGIMIGASLLHPFLPETSEKIAKMLNAPLRGVTELGSFGRYPSGTRVTDAPEILFARLDMEKTMEAINAKFPPKKPEPEKKIKPKKAEVEKPKTVEAIKKAEISFDDFMKMELQVGEVLSCEPVDGSKKLLCSQVQVSGRVLQIVSGIRKQYSPEDMVGKKVVVITNLAPARLAGVESQGMLLCAENSEGELSLLTVDKPADIEGGSFIS